MKNTLTFDIEADELELFLQDVNEHLETMEAGILRLEQASDPDTLNATFRAAHTIKAVAATVGHHQMAELTHTLETLFDAMRDDGLSPTQALTDELLATVDVLKAMRDEVVTRKPSGIDVDAVLARLHALTHNDAGDQKPDRVALSLEAQADQATAPSLEEKTRLLGEAQLLLTPEQAGQAQSYRKQGHTILQVQVTTCADAFARGARLLQAAMTLTKVGHIVAQQPSQADLTKGQHNGHLSLVLATQADKATVEKTLSHVSDLAKVHVQPYSHDLQVSTSSYAPELPPAFPQVPTKQETPTNGTVRISIERLDTLMNLVGELVTDRTRLAQIQDGLHVKYGKNGTNGPMGALSDMVTHFDRVVDQLQEEVMQARMLPIEHLFRKFPRLVRDVARASGKWVNLVIEGEATELDRSVIEVIGDPLIHLLRNGVDHGIEPPQERDAAGKPPAGTVWLTAAHEEGHIVITVRDDGGGIDPQRVRRSAVSRGLLSEEEAAQLDDDAAINLIFQPHLSTAEQVTDVSGRGVGLDVVLTNVKQLGGSVLVESEIGRGTTFRITLPLTLAIVQAMMVGLGDDVYAIPLTSIVESLYLADANGSSVGGKPVIQWRDQVLPLAHLRELFAHSRLSAAPVNGDKQAIVTVVWGKLKVGLVVDKLLGKQEIVVKSLGSFIGNVPGLSGCTILGDGRIGLIVDVPGLVGTCLQAQR